MRLFQLAQLLNMDQYVNSSNLLRLEMEKTSIWVKVLCVGIIFSLILCPIFYGQNHAKTATVAGPGQNYTGSMLSSQRPN